MPSIPEMKAEMDRIVDRAERAHDPELAELERQAKVLRQQIRDAERNEDIRKIGRWGGDGEFYSAEHWTGADLYGALKAAGFDRRSRPSVAVDFAAVVGTKAATFSGSETAPDYGYAVPQRVGAPPFGADQRFLAPSLVTSAVGPDITAVTSFKQTARTLADPGPTSGDEGMIRPITSTAPKPETDSETAVVTEELVQVATVSSGVANIMLENAQFRDFINFDLTLAYRTALDAHCISQVETANPPAGDPGANLIEAILNAALAVAAAGYSPSIVAASPEDLLALTLTPQPGSQDYVSTFANQIDLGVRKVAVAGLPTPMVLDPAALGTLYVSPVSFRTFEENAGSTNSSLVRIESNALFLVQRGDAVATVTLSGS